MILYVYDSLTKSSRKGNLCSVGFSLKWAIEMPLTKITLKIIYYQKDKIILKRKAISLFLFLNFCHRVFSFEKISLVKKI